MEDVHGYNDEKQARPLRDFIVPSGAEALFLLLASFMLLIITNARLVWLTLLDSTKVAPLTATEALEPNLAYLDQIFSAELFGQVSVALVWCLIGCVAYMSLWSFQHFFSRVKEDIDESTYVRPKKQGYWNTRFSQYVYFAANAIIFTIFVSFFIVVLFPLAVGMAAGTLHNYSVLTEYSYFGMAMLLLSLGIYCLVRFWRMAAYAFTVTFGGEPEV